MYIFITFQISASWMLDTVKRLPYQSIYVSNPKRKKSLSKSRIGRLKLKIGKYKVTESKYIRY